MATFHLFILSIFLLTIQINGYPNGAPKKACTGSMVPKHHHYTPQPPSTSPLTTFSSAWNPDGETISGIDRSALKFIVISLFPLVQIESNEPIKGIFVQGRLMNGMEPLGTFVNIPSGTHLVNCPSVRKTKRILFFLDWDSRRLF